MAWVDLTYKANFDCAANIDADNKVYVTLQYEDTEISPTSAKIRFKLNNTDGINYWDSFYILTEQSTSGTLYKMKNWTGLLGNKASWPYYSSAFTVTKAYNAAGFKIPCYYIIDNGHDAVAVPTSTAAAYKMATNTRKNYSCAVDSYTVAIEKSKTVAGNIGKGSIEIIDNYNNTFTVKGTKGINGTNNPSTGPTISWGYTANCNVDGAVTNQTLNIPTPANATRTVWAKCVTGATYGAGNTVVTSKAIKQYVAPGDPGVPLIFYTKNRLTLKEDWTFTWLAAPAANDSSPVVGYRIRVYKNNELIKGIALNSSGNLILRSATNEWVDRDSASTSISFNPIELGFKVGDTVRVGIYAYTRYGANNTGTQLFSVTAVHKISAPFIVQNAGIANVNINGSWKEGQVYVNIGGTWKEAESVYANVAGTWKESQ